MPTRRSQASNKRGKQAKQRMESDILGIKISNLKKGMQMLRIKVVAWEGRDMELTR